MVVDPGLTDRRRLQSYAQLLLEIGLPVTALDGKTPQDRSIAIRGAVNKMVEETKEDEKLLNLPTIVRMGDEDMPIRELPHVRNIEWCRMFTRVVQEEEKTRGAVTEDMAAGALFDGMVSGMLSQYELVKAYLAPAQAVPEGTTASQLSKAMEVMRHKAFPLLAQLEGMSPILAAHMKEQGPSASASPE